MGRLVGWWVGWLVGGLVGWWVGWLVGWVGGLVGWGACSIRVLGADFFLGATFPRGLPRGGASLTWQSLPGSEE